VWATELSSTTVRWQAARPRREHRLDTRAAIRTRSNPNMERAMKLTSALVERALAQFDAQAIPDDHPVLPQLNRLFGDHTFFIDGNGLNIVEPAEAPPGAQAGQVVNIASWNEATPPSLEPHEPAPTELLLDLGSKH
jgi:hypothetical protein